MAVTPYGIDSVSKKEQVATMFNNIANRYDFLNRFLSFGIDQLWRKKAISKLKSDKPSLILDIATGTGDFAIQSLTLKPLKITGVDISEGMLAEGRKKIESKGLSSKIELLSGDSENLQFPDNTFDAATVAFGVRNFENLEKGLKEINRVLKPGGKLVVLEFSKPEKFPIKQLYGFYSHYILPFWGRLFSSDRSAYSYLPASVDAFPFGEAFLSIMNRSGFSQTEATKLSGGIASVYTGKK